MKPFKRGDRPKAVAFDVFGTLCSGAPISELLKWHRPLPGSERRRVRKAWMCGKIGYPELIACGDTTAAPPAEVLGYQAEATAASIALYANARIVLDALVRQNVGIACVSNLVPPLGPRVRDILSPWIPRERCIFSYEVEACKPDRAMFERVAATLATPLSHILMVGDSPRSDIDGAAAVDMPALWISQRGVMDAASLDEVLRRF